MCTAKIVGGNDELLIAEWESQRDGEEGDDYHDCIDNPPSPIAVAYSWRNACDADGEFALPALPSLSQSVSSALAKAADSTPPLLKSVRSTMV